MKKQTIDLLVNNLNSCFDSGDFDSFFEGIYLARQIYPDGFQMTLIEDLSVDDGNLQDCKIKVEVGSAKFTESVSYWQEAFETRGYDELAKQVRNLFNPPLRPRHKKVSQ